LRSISLELQTVLVESTILPYGQGVAKRDVPREKERETHTPAKARLSKVKGETRCQTDTDKRETSSSVQHRREYRINSSRGEL